MKLEINNKDSLLYIKDVIDEIEKDFMKEKKFGGFECKIEEGKIKYFKHWVGNKF